MILNSFIKQAEQEWHKKLLFAPSAKKIFFEYHFPGNFREIRSTINSLFASNQREIGIKDLPELFFRKALRGTNNLKENEKMVIEKAYQQANYVMAETARKLGYSNPFLLKKKMEKLGIKIWNKVSN
jgi:DNA-binding NtrC family response regulator